MVTVLFQPLFYFLTIFHLPSNTHNYFCGSWVSFQFWDWQIVQWDTKGTRGSSSKPASAFSPSGLTFECDGSVISLPAYRFTLMALDVWLAVTLHPSSLGFPTEAGWLSCIPPNIHTASKLQASSGSAMGSHRRARLSTIVFEETEVKPKVSRWVFGVWYSLKTCAFCFLFLFFFKNPQKIIWSFHRAKQKFLRQILFILEIYYSRVIYTHMYNLGISSVWTDVFQSHPPTSS